MSLPVETLDAARPALEDLRLYDDAGNEVPYLIDRPVPVAKVVQEAKSFQVSLNANTTVITLETGLAQPLDGVTLESPATDFIKAVSVESSDDGKRLANFCARPADFSSARRCKSFANFIPADRLQNGSALPWTTVVRRRFRSPARSSTRPPARLRPEN